jgi:hypothetical protein
MPPGRLRLSPVTFSRCFDPFRLSEGVSRFQCADEPGSVFILTYFTTFKGLG